VKIMKSYPGHPIAFFWLVTDLVSYKLPFYTHSGVWDLVIRNILKLVLKTLGLTLISPKKNRKDR
jgi:hypothetical protein